MISDPNHERFYADNNDRMPAFAEHGGDASQNLLTQQQLGLVVDWLRGEWYEPAAEAETAESDAHDARNAERLARSSVAAMRRAA